MVHVKFASDVLVFCGQTHSIGRDGLDFYLVFNTQCTNREIAALMVTCHSVSQSKST